MVKAMQVRQEEEGEAEEKAGGKEEAGEKAEAVLKAMGLEEEEEMTTPLLGRAEECRGQEEGGAEDVAAGCHLLIGTGF